MNKVCVFSTHIQLSPYEGAFNYSKMTFQNFRRYAQYHGYDYIFNTEPNPKYFMINGLNDCIDGRYPYVYQLYKVNELLQNYDIVFFIASDMLITKNFQSLEQEYGNDVDYGADSKQYQTYYLNKLLNISKWDGDSKKYISQQLRHQHVSYYFPNSFVISKNVKGLYDIEQMKSIFKGMTNKNIGYPFSNNDLQLLKYIDYTRYNKINTYPYQQNKQYFYNDIVLKYWNNYNEYPHQEILSNNKLPLFCGCGSYGPQFMIRYKLIKDIVTKYPHLVY